MNKFFPRFALLLLLCSSAELFAQTFSDGPIQLQVRLKDVSVGFTETDAGVLGVGFAPDEPVIHCWAQDNADLDGQGWQGPGNCHNYSIANLPQITPAINEIIFNYTYPTATVPQFYDLRMDNHEDDNSSDNLFGLGCSGGSVCGFDAVSCCGFILFGNCIGLNEGDDKHCVANPFATQLPYRNGPPCQWFNQGYITGTCGNDWKPGIETYWRYTNGASCATAIDMGTLNAGGTLTHFNSNECYSNTHTLSPGNDVWYKFSISGPIGITASLCGVTGAQFDSYLYLYSACGQVVPDTSNDDGCGTQSTLAYSLCNAGDYYLVVDGKAASDMGTFTLTLSDNPNFQFSVTAAPTHITCNGANNGQAQANVTGGVAPYTYAWSNGAGNVSLVTGLPQGSITVSVTDANGCTATSSVVINEPAAMTVATSSIPITCGGACDGSASATPAGGTTPYGYAWNSLPPQSLANATFLCAGNYIVTVTDANGCLVTSNVTVANTVTMTITLVQQNNVQCFGLANGSVDISVAGGQLPYGFNWSNSAVTEDISGLGPNTYTLTITDGIGCTVNASYTITEPPVLTSTVNYQQDPECFGDDDGIVDITVLGGVQPYTYVWSAPSNATTEDIFSGTAATHTVTVTDANGCTANASATLVQPAAYNITLATLNVLCPGGANGSATINVSGATAPYSYFWSNGQNGTSINGLDGGPFTVLIEDLNGCDTLVSGNINEPAEIQILLTAFEPLCADSGNGSITTNASNGTAPYSYAWSGTGGFTSSVQNPQVSSGSYTVTVTDANNCTETASIGVNAPSPFTVTVVPINPLCIGDSSGLAVANTEGGTSPYTFVWSSSALDTLSFLGKIARGFYSVTVTDANGCQSTGQTFVDDPTVDDPSCQPDQFVVLVPSAFTPNGDNINDKLVAIMKNVQKLEMHVFNRWGQEVYYNSDLFPGDGWDGSYKGREQPMGAYVYVFNVTYLNGVRATEQGTSTLVR